MIDNPLASRYIKQNYDLYPPTLQAVFNAVNRYAYEACAPIEGPLGEGYGYPRKPPFDYRRLVEATTDNISRKVKDPDDMTGRGLRNALSRAALTDAELENIIEITKAEALARIDQATSGDKKAFHEHGHHGRQYIASHTVERVMREVLPLNP
ncbi:MAG: hypothetical protein HYS17_08695 [Micavibrio aeruginosavorus]|uniref:Uncharacterized protein n=1 Tax=Micavibrio aeruginosavorus TaxID=349221 RepID=A0A7T5R135_9BACT|nr:MAG: hypothetical protein HYS17_08695 [Micavibrio aeruginosavorus]